jgi:hypothetical protein
MGKSPSNPHGATNQLIVYPKGKSAPVYQFDPHLFDKNSWPKLKNMFTKVGCVSGCRLETSHVDKRSSHQHKAS